jgi:hypothetical protein
MEMYIWYSLEGLTDNWHDGGGLMIVASSLEEAWETNESCKGKQPDLVYRLLGDPEENEIIFPNAGCC